MEVSPDIAQSHQQLSSVAREFLDYVDEHPECLDRFKLDTSGYPKWIQDYPFSQQSWPTFVGARKLEDLRRATVGATHLVARIPELLFRNDPEKIASFYGLEDLHLVELYFRPPNGLVGALSRCDFVETRNGLKLLEVNLGSKIGGWQMRFWAQQHFESPQLSHFLGERGVAARYRDPFEALLSHIVEETLCMGICESMELNVAVVVIDREEDFARGIKASLNEFYSEFLERRYSGIEGEIVICEYPELEVDSQGRTCHESTVVHAVIENTNTPIPEQLYSCFKARKISFYDGPAVEIMNSKRNIALLSASEELEIFSPEERAIIRDYIPWTRDVVEGETSFHGERVELYDLLDAQRENFVLKKNDGSGGQGVHVGRNTSREDWLHVVQKGVADGGWIVQEYVESRPYIYQHGKVGCAPHDVVWGTFCFGNSYGGGFLRMTPRGTGDGIINSVNGADEGIILEV